MLALCLSRVGLLRLLPGPEALWSGGWQGWPELGITAGDVCVWRFFGWLLGLSLLLLKKNSLHWLSEVWDLGCGGISFFERLILYERWAGKRLAPETSIPRSCRLGRPISVSAASGSLGSIFGSCVNILLVWLELFDVCLVGWEGLFSWSYWR